MAKKPSAILIGDSICMGYRPLVQQRISDKIDILGITGNGGDSDNLLKNLDGWAINREADFIHFNCGLHDLKFERDAKIYQQPIDIYEVNLKKIVEKLKKTDKKLIWATTTPVIDERHNKVKPFDRYLRDVQSYNQVALTIMKEAGIVINDLYSVIQGSNIETCLAADGVHFTEFGNKLLTDAVCACLLNVMVHYPTR